MRSGSEPPPRRLAVVLAVLVLALTGGAVPASAQPGPAPLSAPDADLVVKVRLAGLWEMPAGEWAMSRAPSPRVREVGMALMIDHGRLDTATRALAQRLGVELPGRPTAEQQGWLAEMREAPTGEQFERIFVNRLRAAHGKVLATIASVRAGTRHDAIREYANTANQAVLRHINLLESTGLVDYGALPEPVLSNSASAAGAALDLEATDIVAVAVLAVLLCGATVLLLRLARSKRTRSGEDHA